MTNLHLNFHLLPKLTDLTMTNEVCKFFQMSAVLLTWCYVSNQTKDGVHFVTKHLSLQHTFSSHKRDMQSWLWHTYTVFNMDTYHLTHRKNSLFLNLFFFYYVWYLNGTSYNNKPESICTETESRHVDAKSLVIIWL